MCPMRSNGLGIFQLYLFLNLKSLPLNMTNEFNWFSSIFQFKAFATQCVRWVQLVQASFNLIEYNLSSIFKFCSSPVFSFLFKCVQVMFLQFTFIYPLFSCAVQAMFLLFPLRGVVMWSQGLSGVLKSCSYNLFENFLHFQVLFHSFFFKCSGHVIPRVKWVHSSHVSLI